MRYKWLKLVLSFWLILIAITACRAEREKPERDINKDRKMTLEELNNKVTTEDWDALDIAEELGESALPDLLKHLKNRDAGIRLIALNCVSLIDDPQTLQIVVKYLQDEDSEVRTEAMQVVQDRYEISIISDLIANLDNQDENIREAVPLLLGLLEDDSAIQPLQQQLEIEEDSDVQRSIKLALAKLGNKENKDEFASQFDVDSSASRFQAIKDFTYIADKAYAKRFLPALSDLGPAHNIGTAHNPEYARVCDASISLLANWFEDVFSFETDDLMVYSDEDIVEVKKWLETLE